MQCIQEQIEMDNRNKILKQHPYSITFNNKNGRWYTRFNVDGKIIQRNRKTRGELEDYIIEFYSKDNEPENPGIPFSAAHDKWLAMQEEYGRVPNSIRRYETDWNRFFVGTDFASMNIFEITSRDIEIFVINNIKKFNLKRRSADGLYSCITGVFYNAVMDRLMKAEDNPCLYVDKKKFVKFYNTDGKTIEQRTVSEDDMKLLIDKVNKDINRKPTYVYPYGVRLAALTGMRVGEIAGLRWCHVYDDHIQICESEKYDVVNKIYYQDKTKTGKIRNVPITQPIREFLELMKSLQVKYGLVEDFVLSIGNNKVRCKNLTAYMNAKCIQLRFRDHKSIHAIRRTINSYLRFDGVSATEAGSIIGNTPKVNDAHYTYDIQDITKKKEYLERAESHMLKGIPG